MKVKDARIGREVRLRYVKGRRGVRRSLDGATVRIITVWNYHGGLVRFKVRQDTTGDVLWVDGSQIQWLP